MKENELRIGNWVYHNPSEWSYRNDDGAISNYGKFNEDCFQWDDSDFHAVLECTLSYEIISPIELTEEWLIKFGFDKFDKFFAKHIPRKYNEVIVFEKGVYFYQVWKSRKKEIKYVHQLQNLYFALTGEELEIK